MLIFAVRPALAAGDWKTAALFGALFGFFTYATYDLTNMRHHEGLDLARDPAGHRLGHDPDRL